MLISSNEYEVKRLKKRPKHNGWKNLLVESTLLDGSFGLVFLRKEAFEEALLLYTSHVEMDHNFANLPGPAQGYF